MPVLVVGAALLLIALASHVVPGHYGRDAPSRVADATSSPATPVHSASTRPSGRPPTQIHHYTLLLPVLILVGLILIGLGWLIVGRLLARLLPGRHVGRALTPVLADAPDNAAELTRRVGAAVDEGLDEITEGPVADAIVACWLRLADAAVSSGVTLRRSDTPAETVVRVLGRGPVRVVPLQRLADLYREARFSTHEMDEAARGAARTALEQIRTDLTDTTSSLRRPDA